MRTLLLALSLVACGPPPQPQPSGDTVPEFTLLDVNPSSRTANQQVGPSALRGVVSGWYFTHAG